MNRPRTGLRPIVIACKLCGWHMQIETDVQIVGEDETTWKCSSTLTHASRIAVHAAAVSHKGPIVWGSPDDEDIDMNLEALGLYEPEHISQSN